MKDEEYLYKQDVRQKGSIARSARSRRTHNGGRGRMRLPSDNMTEKELQKMNGEVKSYRLNDPITWVQFKAMPDDIKVVYVKALREKFGVPDCKLAEMMGVTKGAVSHEIKRIGLGHGEKHGGRRAWDEKGFYAWLNGTKEEKQEEVVEEDVVEAISETPKVEFFPVLNAIPTTGMMTFEGYTQDIVRTISDLFGKANIHLQITWDVLAEGEK